MHSEEDLASAKRKIGDDPTIKVALDGIRGHLSVIFNQVLPDELTYEEILALVGSELDWVYEYFASGMNEA